MGTISTTSGCQNRQTDNCENSGFFYCAELCSFGWNQMDWFGWDWMDLDETRHHGWLGCTLNSKWKCENKGWRGKKAREMAGKIVLSVCSSRVESLRCVNLSHKSIYAIPKFTFSTTDRGREVRGRREGRNMMNRPARVWKKFVGVKAKSGSVCMCVCVCTLAV